MWFRSTLSSYDLCITLLLFFFKFRHFPLCNAIMWSFSCHWCIGYDVFLQCEVFSLQMKWNSAALGRVTASFLSWEQVSLWAPSTEGYARWRCTDPGARFSLLPSRVFIFQFFFFFFLFPFNISDKKKKMIWSLRYNFFFFIYPSPTLTSSKGDLWIFNQLFLGVQQRGSKGDISSGICNQPDVERLVLPLQNSRCRHLWLWFLFFFSIPPPLA